MNVMCLIKGDLVRISALSGQQQTVWKIYSEKPDEQETSTNLNYISIVTTGFKCLVYCPDEPVGRPYDVFRTLENNGITSKDGRNDW